MQVCEQCHLETASRMLPDRIRRYDREPFSYEAGQPLEEFNAYFVRDAAKGKTDNFEIVNGAGPGPLYCFLFKWGVKGVAVSQVNHARSKSPGRFLLG